MDEMRNFEKDVSVNRNMLHKCCEEQPSLYYYYSDQLAEKKSEKDRENNKLKFIMAETELDIRKNPPEGVKITDKSVLSLVETHQNVVEQKEKLDAIKKEVYVLESAVEALAQRKSALDNLVVLWSKNYYSTPDGGRNNPNDQYQKKYRDRGGR